MADPREAPPPPLPPFTLFLDQTKAQRAEKNFLLTGSPLFPFSKSVDDRPSPPLPPLSYLRVWIRHCNERVGILQVVVYERVGQSVISVSKLRTYKSSLTRLMAVKD